MRRLLGISVLVLVTVAACGGAANAQARDAVGFGLGHGPDEHTGVHRPPGRYAAADRYDRARHADPVGTLSVTIGKVRKSYAISTCASKSATSRSQPRSEDGRHPVVINKTKPVMSGVLDGKAWRRRRRALRQRSRANRHVQVDHGDTNLKITGSYACQ